LRHPIGDLIGAFAFGTKTEFGVIGGEHKKDSRFITTAQGLLAGRRRSVVRASSRCVNTSPSGRLVAKALRKAMSETGRATARFRQNWWAMDNNNNEYDNYNIYRMAFDRNRLPLFRGTGHYVPFKTFHPRPQSPKASHPESVTATVSSNFTKPTSGCFRCVSMEITMPASRGREACLSE
jgi:hypothetical protein